jgi:hypothetical protein
MPFFPRLKLEFDDGTLPFSDVPDGIPYTEWNDRVDQ